MKLYLISQTERQSYDTYDSAVVAANDESDARQIHPSEFYVDYPGEEKWHWRESGNDTWASTPENVTARYLGEADESLKRGVVLSSFNAG